MVLNGKTIPFEKNSDNIILFGQYNCDVMIPKGKLVIDKDNLIFDDNVEVYVNGIKKYHKTTYAYGDLILLNSMLIVVYDKYLEITAARNSYQCFIPYYQNINYHIHLDLYNSFYLLLTNFFTFSTSFCFVLIKA